MLIFNAHITKDYVRAANQAFVDVCSVYYMCARFIYFHNLFLLISRKTSESHFMHGKTLFHFHLNTGQTKVATAIATAATTTLTMERSIYFFD